MTHQSFSFASPEISSWARWLGLAGLAPQILLAAFVAGGQADIASAASGLALAYSALILSFIGGAWWGLLSNSIIPVRGSIWLVAVAPSLIAFIALGAWVITGSLGLSLTVIGAALIGALWFDVKLIRNGLCPIGWIRLRVPLSLGLGGLTLIVATLS